MPLIKDKRVARVVALSGGYTRDEADRRLSENHGMIASFSRALAQDLRRSMTEAEFDKALKEAIDEIFPPRPSSTEVAVRFYYASGSPFAWRVWLALERKGIPYHLKTLSFDAGDLKTPEFSALNPRRRVPVLVDDDFALAESAAIVEYIEDRWPNGPALFATEPRKRAIQRRMVREADHYLADIGTRFATAPSEENAKDLKRGAFLVGGRRGRRLSDRRALGGRPHRLSIHGAVRADRRPPSGFLPERLHRPASFGLDGSHARAPDRPAHSAAALEMSRPA